MCVHRESVKSNITVPIKMCTKYILPCTRTSNTTFPQSDAAIVSWGGQCSSCHIPLYPPYLGSLVIKVSRVPHIQLGMTTMGIHPTAATDSYTTIENESVQTTTLVYHMNLSAMYAWNYFQLAQEFMWMLGNNHTCVDGNAMQIEQVSPAVNRSKEAKWMV